MGSMLEQAIIDANELREVALKSAQNTLREKYASEFEQIYMSSLNEGEEDPQDEPTDMVTPDTDETQILHDDENKSPKGESVPEPSTEFNLDDFGNEEENAVADDEAKKPSFVLDQLNFAYEDDDGEMVIDLGKFDLDDDEPLDMDSKIPSDINPVSPQGGDKFETPDAKKAGEDFKKELEALNPKTSQKTVDNTKDSKEDDFLSTESITQMMKDLLSEEDSKMNMLEEQLEEKWVEVSKQIEKKYQKQIAVLEDKISNYQAILKESESLNSDLSEKLSKATLAGLKLSYKNKTLNDDSLNERQKKSICKAISGASDFEQAKSIFENLKEGISGNVKQETLTETISRGSKTPIFVKKSEKKDNRGDSLSESMLRLQALAGIK